MPCANHDWSIERDVIASESPSTSMYATIFVPYFFTKGFEFKQQHLYYLCSHILLKGHFSKIYPMSKTMFLLFPLLLSGN